MSSLYKTKQGALVLDCFKNSGGTHLTIDAVCRILEEKNTPVGKATVYRQVQKLVDEGTVRKYSADNADSACFQYVGDDEHCKQHFHLKCTKCGKLFHASCPYLDGINKHIFEHHGFTVDNTRTVFYGICEDCMREQKKL